MARFKPIHKGLKLLPVDFDRQVIPGRFDYALCHLVDSALDLSAFHARYKNDLEGASAFVQSCRAASTLKPVFGSLRGKAKVDGQWKWYCLNRVFIMGFFYSVVSCVCLRWGFLRARRKCGQLFFSGWCLISFFPFLIGDAVDALTGRFVV